MLPVQEEHERVRALLKRVEEEDKGMAGRRRRKELCDRLQARVKGAREDMQRRQEEEGNKKETQEVVQVRDW